MGKTNTQKNGEPMEQLLSIAQFILSSFIHIWPYLVITIPLAVLVQLSGASTFIHKAFTKTPLASIFLATLLGALSPFCSCGVIPIIASLLIGGVPIAPVMAFWIASPSMDPEIFFLSTATIGLQLSIWRLAATFAISLFAGYFTHFAFQRGWLGDQVLKENSMESANKPVTSITRETILWIKNSLARLLPPQKKLAVQWMGTKANPSTSLNCCAASNDLQSPVNTQNTTESTSSCSSSSCGITPVTFQKKVFNQTVSATWMVVKFMTLAFFINALIQFYVPQHLISNVLGGKGSFSVLIAAFFGIPMYTSNLTALPMISGLIALGMNKGAALAFLIAGPTTTLPAMVAVFGIVKRKIFGLYLSFALLGAILFGFLYTIFG